MQEDFKSKHVHAITGTFVLGVIGVLIVALVFAARSQRWFIGNAALRIALPEAGAAGIRQGSDVYLLGTLVGSVSDVRVDQSGRMDADVKIRRDFYLFLRTDSTAVVKKKFGVVGDAYFELTRGRSDPLPEKNAVIACADPLPGAVESAIEEVRYEAVPALRKLSAGLDTWNALGTNLIVSQSRFEEVIARVENVIAALQQGEGTAGRLLTDPSVANELESFLNKANQTADELKVTIHNLRVASVEVHRASTNLPGISGVLSREARELPGLALQMHTSMREMERLMEAMQRHWLVRKYVDPINPPPLRPSPKPGKPQEPRVELLHSPKHSTR